MCTYCIMGDWAFRYDPPWKIEPLTPYIPQPIKPITPGTHPPWDLQKLKDYRDLLKEIKDLEDKIGCPCEPNKADYLKLFDEQINKITS